jgi:hypothetical protein
MSGALRRNARRGDARIAVQPRVALTRRLRARVHIDAPAFAGDGSTRMPPRTHARHLRVMTVQGIDILVGHGSVGAFQGLFDPEVSERPGGPQRLYSRHSRNGRAICMNSHGARAKRTTHRPRRPRVPGTWPASGPGTGGRDHAFIQRS